jgi:hypothetical protein
LKNTPKWRTFEEIYLEILRFEINSAKPKDEGEVSLPPAVMESDLAPSVVAEPGAAEATPPIAEASSTEAAEAEAPTAGSAAA